MKLDMMDGDDDDDTGRSETKFEVKEDEDAEEEEEEEAGHASNSTTRSDVVSEEHMYVCVSPEVSIVFCFLFLLIT